ncbi:probable serine/threonine-protein kinase DDB_G0282963 [Chrysoperla carnea]|uniref:probable serine/threonine-protein kinase DDB_G0282963 n=1 Tax=Chrysoperla carnea TaxID=189513 RepID=UPI001D076D71|nr:probable serine/threonine-protein kinase DDB_G0282963 [Chrysoperla carnea]
MSSTIMCKNFVQNAWKKDLCSNCFKAREEHDILAINGIKSRYQNQSLPPNGHDTNYQPRSIMKTVDMHSKKIHAKTTSSPVKRNNSNNNNSTNNPRVNFPKDESEVIGYGGEEWSSDTEDFELSEESPEDDVYLAPEDDTERELIRLTKSNTDFNMCNANLLGESQHSVTETRRVFANLMLGKTQTDSDGKKQTLLVSVTPFGQDSSPRPQPQKKLTHTPIAKNKESLTENKTPVILTSYSKSEVDSPKLLSNNKNNKDEKSLLEEINETLEKNKKNNETKLKTESDKNKENVLPAEYIKTKAECVFINGTNNSEPTRQKNGLTRHTVLLKQEKPSIYQTNNKITKDLKNTTNQQQIELNKSTPGSKDEVIEATSPLLVKTEIRFIPTEVLNLKEKEEESETKIRFEETAEKILGLPPISPTKFSSSDVFDVEANSRELAGEPDGRADDSPDIVNEPPALPLTPPPTIVGSIDSRPSFLHSPTKRNQTQDKPKVPVKPNKILQKILNQPTTTSPVTPTLINSLSASSDNIDNNSCDNISTEDSLSGENTYESLKSPLTKQDSGGSDLNRKRRAPKPPPTSSPEEGSPGGTTMYQRNSINNLNHDSPVVREKEKRERASSCSPKFRNGVNTNPAGGESTPNLSLIPEPAPRRSLSLSQDSLAITSPANNIVERPDEKKKHRGRFSLKKFLRMGSNNSSKEVEKTYTTHLTSTISMPQPRPRLVIVHPTDLINGTEVLKSDDTLSTSNESTSNVSSSSERDTPSPPRPCKPPPPPRNNTPEWKMMNKLQPLPPKNDELLRQQKIWNNNYIKKPCPKENIYANVGEVRAVLTPSKPVRTASMREREAAHLEATQNRRNKENTYNGLEHLQHHQVELRKDISPSSSPTENVYDLINGQRSSSPECDSSLGKSSPPTNNKNLCNGRNGLNNNTPRRSADGSTNGFLDNSSEYLNGKYNHLTNGYVRTTSLPYCGSETESEIYSPYSFYGSEADVGDDESEWTNTGTRTCRLRSRKGRSIVHKNLEDNYGAVVVANHEALAQVLEHMHQTTIIQPALRGLKTAPNLRWTDFSIVDTTNSNQLNGGGNNGGSGGLNGCITSAATRHIGRRCFHTALWGAHHVTLALTLEQGSMLQTNTILSLAPFTLVPITEFSDLVPYHYLPNNNNNTSINNNNNDEDTKIVQATIAVLPWMQVDTIQSMGALLRSKLSLSMTSTTGASNTSTNNENNNNIEQSASRTSSIMNSITMNNNAAEELHCREACFVMLQLINGLKCLQAQGIEELPLSLSSFALCRELERDTHPRLCVLQGLSEEISRVDIGENGGDRLGSLCECALRALNELLPKSALTSLLEDLLRRERAISLTQVKSVLEFTLWGPSDVTLTTPIKDRELALQRWLDLERATVLHGLVRTRVQLTVFEECHLLFLVRSTAKMMCEASLLLDTIVKTS